MPLFYRQELVEAAQALIDDDGPNVRLTCAASVLLQVGGDGAPAEMLARSEAERAPLIGKAMVANGAMVPRDFDPAAAEAAAVGILDLLRTEMTGRSYLPASVEPEHPTP